MSSIPRRREKLRPHAAAGAGFHRRGTGQAPFSVLSPARSARTNRNQTPSISAGRVEPRVFARPSLSTICARAYGEADQRLPLDGAGADLLLVREPFSIRLNAKGRALYAIA